MELECRWCNTPVTEDDWPVEFNVGMIQGGFCRYCWNGIVEGVQINYEWEGEPASDFDIDEHSFVTSLRRTLTETVDLEGFVKHYDMLRDVANRKESRSDEPLQSNGA